MKQGYIAMSLTGGELVHHKHPVFTGGAACDCKLGETPVLHSKESRLFNSIGEMITALNDFRREFPNEKMPGNFFPLLVVCVE